MLQKETAKRNYALKINAFFMLDALVGMLALLLALSMLLSIIQLTVKTEQLLRDDTCDTFYMSMKIRELGGMWRLKNEASIFTEEITIEVVNNEEIIKRSNQGGYEYLGSCQGVKFVEKGDDVAIVFEKTSGKDEKAIYSLTKKKK